MRKYALLTATLAVIFLSGFIAAENWITYKSVAGHFSISFPGKVEESEDTSKTEDGRPFTIHIVTRSASDDEVYMVGWIDMGSFYPEGKSIKDILEDSRDGAVGSMEATDVKTITTNLNGNPYIEFTFKAKDIVGKDRIYVINKFQYSLITLCSSKLGLKPAADKFISSYKYIP